MEWVSLAAATMNPCVSNIADTVAGSKKWVSICRPCSRHLSNSEIPTLSLPCHLTTQS